MADTYSFDLTPYMREQEDKPQGLFDKTSTQKIEEGKSFYQEMADMLKAYWLDEEEAYKPKAASVSDDIELSIYDEYSKVSPEYARDIIEGLDDAASYREQWGIETSLRDVPVMLEEQGDFVAEEETPVTTEELPAIDPETGQTIKSAADVAAEPVVEEPAQDTGLMSRPRHRQVELDDMPTNINTTFLGQQEGKAIKTAYVPKNKKGEVLDKSGVTVGTGVDLGSKDRNYFRYLGDDALVDKLEPYFGKKRASAVAALKEKPLTLTADEVKKLDTYVKKIEFRTLKNRWNKDSAVKWEDLSEGKATAVASVYYQYGQKMFGHNFWRQTTGGEWQDAYSNLMNYGDKYPSRRKREAAVLKKDL